MLKKQNLQEKRDADIRSLKRGFVFEKPDYFQVNSLRNTVTNFELPSVSLDRTRAGDQHMFQSFYQARKRNIESAKTLKPPISQASTLKAKQSMFYTS
jgi:hypothetical protein